MVYPSFGVSRFIERFIQCLTISPFNIIGCLLTTRGNEHLMGKLVEHAPTHKMFHQFAHNMAQARRASEECIFMLMGKLVEHAPTHKMFVTPSCQETADYIEGRYG